MASWPNDLPHRTPKRTHRQRITAPTKTIRPRTSRLAALFAGLLAVAPAVASGQTPRNKPSATPVSVFRVRVLLSEGAAKRLAELRVRRLFRLELDDVAELEEPHAGTLEGDGLIRVWIDVPIEHRAVVEVRRVNGSFARRALEIGGFPSDVAAEVVTLAAADMVRVQAGESQSPTPEPKPSSPAPAAGGEGFAVGGGASALLLPSSTPVFFVGPELALELRHGMFGHRVYSRWQLGVGDVPARWLEVGVGLDFRWSLAPSWRAHLGVKGGFVDVSLPEATLIDGHASTHDWTMHLAGEIGIEARVAPGSWLALSVEPGAALRPLDVQHADLTTTQLGGFAFGINLGLNASPFDPE